MVTELAPILAVMVFGFLPTVELVEAVPIVAAAATGSLEASVVVERQQLAQRELCDR